MLLSSMDHIFTRYVIVEYGPQLTRHVTVKYGPCLTRCVIVEYQRRPIRHPFSSMDHILPDMLLSSMDNVFRHVIVKFGPCLTRYVIVKYGQCLQTCYCRVWTKSYQTCYCQVWATSYWASASFKMCRWGATTSITLQIIQSSPYSMCNIYLVLLQSEVLPSFMQ
jgi:hypothetical protein